MSDRIVGYQNLLAGEISIACAEGWLSRSVLAVMMLEYREALKREGLYFNQVAAQSIGTLRRLTRQIAKKK